MIHKPCVHRSSVFDTPIFRNKTEKFINHFDNDHYWTFRPWSNVLGYRNPLHYSFIVVLVHTINNNDKIHLIMVFLNSSLFLTVQSNRLYYPFFFKYLDFGTSLHFWLMNIRRTLFPILVFVNRDSQIQLILSEVSFLPCFLYRRGWYRLPEYIVTNSSLCDLTSTFLKPISTTLS